MSTEIKVDEIHCPDTLYVNTVDKEREWNYMQIKEQIQHTKYLEKCVSTHTHTHTHTHTVIWMELNNTLFIQA